MAGTQRLTAIAMAFLLTGTSGSGKPDVLGIVVQANRANLGSYSVSEGTTVYDGDRISTEPEGNLRFRGGAVMLSLEGESSAIVHSSSDGTTKEFCAELVSGSAVLSAGAGAGAEIVARSAHVRPGGNAASVIHVRVLGEKELIISARRGPVQFSYREESVTIDEGKSYWVVLDPPQDGAAASQNEKRPGGHNKTFVLIAVGAAAAVAGVVLWKTRRGVESPDHP